MTSEQREAVVTAYKRGYFQIPRQTTLTTLAESFDISDSAYSQRLRRGLSIMIHETMIEDRSR
ncbi:helix-turn-helix domain-containing protein [Haladaptatus sp. DFWS20]|uniref:helix-turn-helix domain-containing protein n=1 Tax=Haladaptatus sp. DFWS20 TaxID=3403467 RepID=UPI003EB6C7FC